MEKTYIKRGMRLARDRVKQFDKTAYLLEQSDGQFIISNDHGTALSPICTGERPAWRFAAMLVSFCAGEYLHNNRYLDDTDEVEQ